jgi:hypothetical protein
MMMKKQFLGMVFAIATLIVIPWISTQSSYAAIPPLSAQKRQEHASHIVIGKVTSIQTKEVAVQYGTNYEHAAKVQIETLEKPRSAKRKYGQTMIVYYTTIKDREAGWTGSQHQSHPLKRGAKIKLFLIQGRDGKLHLLEPNGWEAI